MSSPKPDLKQLKELWRGRLNDAKLQLDFARSFTGEDKDLTSTATHRRRLVGEDKAEAEYVRVLRIYNDLMTLGKIPDETEWSRGKAESASGSEFPPQE